MARIKGGGARQSSRHVGQRYGVGYQYRIDEEHVFTFGPFDGMSFDPPGETEHTVPLSVDKGFVSRGWIRPAFKGLAGRTSTDANLRFQSKTFFLDGLKTEVLAIRNTSNLIHFDYVVEGSTGSKTTGITYTGTVFDMIAYGDNIYWTYDGATGVRKYDPSASTDVEIANSPADAHFIFVLGNNMCVVTQVTGGWQVDWAIDGTPSDWIGTGSGNNPIPPALGNVMGIAVLDDRAIIVGQNASLEMTPTGVLPAFTFRVISGLPGTRRKQAVVGVGDTVYFLDRVDRPAFYRNGRVSTMGIGEEYINAKVYVVHLPTLRMVMFAGTSPDGDFLRFYDLENNQLVGVYTVTSDEFIVSEHPKATNIESLYFLATTGTVGHVANLSNNFSVVLSAPIVITQWVHFPYDIQLLGAEIDINSSSAPTFKLILQKHTGGTIERTLVNDTSAKSHYVYMGDNWITQGFQAKVTFSNAQIQDRLQRIRIFYKLLSSEGHDVMQV